VSDKAKVEKLLYDHGYRLQRALKPTIWRNAQHHTLSFDIPQSDWNAWATLLSHLRQQAHGAAHNTKVKFTLPDLSLSESRVKHRVHHAATRVLSPPKTKGTGIYYEEKIVEEPTPEELAAKAQRQAEKRTRREEVRRRRKDRRAALERIDATVVELLAQWKSEVDATDNNVLKFPGWTEPSFCPLPYPVDVTDVAFPFVNRSGDITKKFLRKVPDVVLRAYVLFPSRFSPARPGRSDSWGRRSKT